MNTYNSLINNLEALELNRIKENIDKFLMTIRAAWFATKRKK